MATAEIDSEPPEFGPPILDAFVRGKPARQGSNAFLGKGRVAPDDPELYVWRERVATVLRRTWKGRPQLPDSAAVVARVTFFLLKPATTAAYKVYPIKDKDLDKYLRAALDSVADTSDDHPGAGIIHNDNRVICAAALKVYANPSESEGMRIELWQIPAEYERERWVPYCDLRYIRRANT